MAKKILILGVALIMCLGLFAGCGNKDAKTADVIRVHIDEEYLDDFAAKQLKFDLDDEVVVYNIDNYYATQYTVDIFLTDGKSNGVKKSTKKIIEHLKTLEFVTYGSRMVYSLNRVSVYINTEFRDKFSDGFTLEDFRLDNAESLQYTINDWAEKQSVNIILKETGRNKIFEALEYLKTLEFVETAIPIMGAPNMGFGYPGDDFYKEKIGEAQK